MVATQDSKANLLKSLKCSVALLLWSKHIINVFRTFCQGVCNLQSVLVREILSLFLSRKLYSGFDVKSVVTALHPDIRSFWGRSPVQFVRALHQQIIQYKSSTRHDFENGTEQEAARCRVGNYHQNCFTKLGKEFTFICNLIYFHRYFGNISINTLNSNIPGFINLWTLDGKNKLCKKYKFGHNSSS